MLLSVAIMIVVHQISYRCNFVAALASSPCGGDACDAHGNIMVSFGNAPGNFIMICSYDFTQ